MSHGITYLYLISFYDGLNGYSKVGVAGDTAARLSQLQVGNPHDLDLFEAFPFPDRASAFAAERKVHDLLAARRLRGEWFDSGPDVPWLAIQVVTGARPLEELRLEQQRCWKDAA